MQALNIQSGPNEAALQQTQTGVPVRNAEGQDEFSFDALLEEASAGLTDKVENSELLLRSENSGNADFSKETGKKTAFIRFSQMTSAENSALQIDDVKNEKKSEVLFETDADIPVLSAEDLDSVSELLLNRRENSEKQVKKDADGTEESLAAQFSFLSEKKIKTDKKDEILPDGGEKKVAASTDPKPIINEIPSIMVDDRRTRITETESGLQTAVSVDKNGNAEMSLTVAPQSSQSAVLSDGLPVKNAQNFSHMLSQEIQNNASELVKTGSIILRDNNAGTINMILHPQELGNVKIKLELSDKVITGKITVESLEAFNAFKSNLHTLRTAFTESGFTGAGFELNWSGSGGQGSENGRQRGDERNQHAHFYSELMPQAAFTQDEKSASYAFGAVNVMA